MNAEQRREYAAWRKNAPVFQVRCDLGAQGLAELLEGSSCRMYEITTDHPLSDEVLGGMVK